MLRKIFLPLLAISGVGICVFMIFFGAKKPPVSKIIFPPPKAPYKYYIAGEGVVESAYKNIALSIPFGELISDVYCSPGQIVKKGDPLFKLDTRHLEAQLVESLQAQKVAETDYENQKIQFSFYEKLQNRSAVSEQAYQSAFYNKKLALERVKVAQANVQLIRTDIERSICRAPISGEILQINIRIGQYANVNPYDKTPLILFGDTSVYHLRVDIDEEDSWRIIKGAKATAFVRGNSKIIIPLNFAYAEPYIIPKVSLSGSDTERVDTRVLQLVFSFPKDRYPVFAGQLLDVYLEAKSDEIAS